MTTNWHFKELTKNLNKSSFELKYFTIGSSEEIKKGLKNISPFPSKNTENDYQEFISPDNKLKLKYPAGWITAAQEFLQSFIPKDQQETYNLRTIFSAQYFGIDGLAQIAVYQGNFAWPVEKISQKMHETDEEGREIKIINSEVGEKEGVFETTYAVSGNPKLHSKEKILKEGEENTYLITFVALDKNWENFAKEADFIINSARLLTEPLK